MDNGDDKEHPGKRKTGRPTALERARAAGAALYGPDRRDILLNTTHHRDRREAEPD